LTPFVTLSLVVRVLKTGQFVQEDEDTTWMIIPTTLPMLECLVAWVEQYRPLNQVEDFAYVLVLHRDGRYTDSYSYEVKGRIFLPDWVRCLSPPSRTALDCGRVALI
jgi:hypothetical protein